MTRWPKIGAGAAALCVATAVLVAGLVTWYVGQERYLYSWDYAEYQGIFERLADRLRASPLLALAAVANSIGRDEYNQLPTLFLSPFALVFGQDRLTFILTIALVFAVPAIVLFSALLAQLARLGRPQPAAGAGPGRAGVLLAPVLVLALMPQFWVPVLAGYVDVVGLAVLFAVLVLYLRQPAQSLSYRQAAAIGLLLCLLIALRRWYAYWAVGFLVAAGAQAAWQAVRSWRAGAPDPLGAVKRVVVIGATAVAAFFLVARSVALRMLTTNYADVYSAYRTSETRLQQLQQLYGHFGLLILATAVLGLALAAADRRLRAVAAFLALQFAVSYALFSRVQDMAVQHFYLVLATVAIFSALFALHVYGRLRAPLARAAWLLLLAAVGLANLSSVLVPAAGPALEPARALLPAIRSYPKTRDDLPEVYRLLTVLKGLTDGTDAKVYVLASSFTLNSHLMVRACLTEPSLRELAPRILVTHDVDKRDGFPRHWLDARYVVVSDPIAYHLAPQDQLVIGAMARRLLDQQGAGRAFEKMPQEFTLDGGQKVYLYRKQRPFTAAELEELQSEFLRRYPDRPDQFRIGQARMRQATGVRAD